MIIKKVLIQRIHSQWWKYYHVIFCWIVIVFVFVLKMSQEKKSKIVFNDSDTNLLKDLVKGNSAVNVKETQKAGGTIKNEVNIIYESNCCWKFGQSIKSHVIIV